MSASLSLEEAVVRLAAGGLVAFPTETAWGLAADASSASAVEALRRCKGRDADKPLSVLVADVAEAEKLGVAFSGLARALAAAFWPGPLTLVLPCAAALAPGVANAGGGLGLRCSPHPVASALARAAAREALGPLTATSLNRAGEPALRRRADAERWLAGSGVPLLEGADAGGEPESSVVDLCGDAPVLLREGAIAREQLVAVFEEAQP